MERQTNKVTEEVASRLEIIYSNYAAILFMFKSIRKRYLLYPIVQPVLSLDLCLLGLMMSFDQSAEQTEPPEQNWNNLQRHKFQIKWVRGSFESY